MGRLLYCWHWKQERRSADCHLGNASLRTWPCDRSACTRAISFVAIAIFEAYVLRGNDGAADHASCRVRRFARDARRLAEDESRRRAGYGRLRAGFWYLTGVIFKR